MKTNFVRQNRSFPLFEIRFLRKVNLFANLSEGNLLQFRIKIFAPNLLMHTVGKSIGLGPWCVFFKTLGSRTIMLWKIPNGDAYFLSVKIYFYNFFVEKFQSVSDPPPLPTPCVYHVPNQPFLTTLGRSFFEKIFKKQKM